MLTTGIFTKFKRDVKCKANEPFYLVPFGDVHFGSPQFSSSHFQRFIDKWRDVPNALFIPMGDYMDRFSTSERKIYNSGFHESSIGTMTDEILEETHAFMDTISPISDRLVGMVEGNHYAMLPGAMTTTQYMCQQLNVPYMGVLCYFRLNMSINGACAPITMLVHHGKGGGKLLGSSINTIQDMMRVAVADVYMMGHDHKLATGKTSQIVMDKNGNIRHVTRAFIRTGSFLKAFEDGKASYIADMCGAPCELGAPHITVIPKRETGKNGKGRFNQIEVTI